MKHYLVDILWEDPYPRNFNYRIEASNIGLASYRAVKELRKENKGRRIKSLTIKIKEYANGL